MEISWFVFDQTEVLRPTSVATKSKWTSAHRNFLAASNHRVLVHPHGVDSVSTLAVRIRRIRRVAADGIEFMVNHGLIGIRSPNCRESFRVLGDELTGNESAA